VERGRVTLGRGDGQRQGEERRDKSRPTRGLLRRGKLGRRRGRAGPAREEEKQTRERRESGLRPTRSTRGKRKRWPSGQREGGEFSSFLFPNPFSFLNSKQIQI